MQATAAITATRRARKPSLRLRFIIMRTIEKTAPATAAKINSSYMLMGSHPKMWEKNHTHAREKVRAKNSQTEVFVLSTHKTTSAITHTHSAISQPLSLTGFRALVSTRFSDFLSDIRLLYHIMQKNNKSCEKNFNLRSVCAIIFSIDRSFI